MDTAAYNVAHDGTASIGIAAGGYVEITDSAANSITLYIPASADDPGGAVCGIVLVDPMDDYNDTWDIIGTGGGGGPGDPLGVGAGGGMFIGPSVGYPYEYFPGHTDTDIKYVLGDYPVSRCSQNNYDSLYRVPVVVAVKNISGGVPPYTVDFSGLTFQFVADWELEWPHCTQDTLMPAVTVSYAGGTGGAGNPVRTGLPLGHGDVVATPDQGSLAAAGLYIDQSAWFSWAVSGSVVVTDSAANSLTFNIPTASDGVVGAIPAGGASGVYVDNYFHPTCRPSEVPCLGP